MHISLYKIGQTALTIGIAAGVIVSLPGHSVAIGGLGLLTIAPLAIQILSKCMYPDTLKLTTRYCTILGGAAALIIVAAKIVTPLLATTPLCVFCVMSVFAGVVIMKKQTTEIKPRHGNP